MAAPPRYDHAAYFRLAMNARFSVALINPVLELEFSASPFSIDIVRNGRAAKADRFRENFAHGIVERKKLLLGQALRNPRGVQARPKQALVGIDVADATQYLLIEEQRFDAGASRSEIIAKFLWGDFERFFPHSALEFGEGRFWHEKYASKAAYVRVAQLPVIIEMEKAMSVG